MASLGELVARMSLDIGQFTGALNKVEQASADTVRSITKEFDKLNSSMVGVVAGFLSIQSAVEKFNQSVERAANLKEMSDAFGVAVGDMDKLSLAMQLTGTDSESLSKQFKTLAEQVTLASNPASKSAEVFKAMGVSLTDAAGNAKSLNVVYEDSIKQLSAIKDPALRAATAQQLFARGSVDALKAAADYDDAMARATKQLELFGTTSDDTAAMAKEFKDEQALIGDALTRIMLPAVKAILPVIGDFVKAMSEGAKGGLDLADVLGSAVALVFRTVATGAIVIVGALKNLALGLAAMAAGAKALVTDGWAAMEAALKAGSDDIEENTKATLNSAMAMQGLMDTTKEAGATAARAGTDSKGLQDALNHTANAAKEADPALKQLVKTYNEIIQLAAQYDAGVDDSKEAKLDAQFAAINDAVAQMPDIAEAAGKAMQVLYDRMYPAGDAAKYVADMLKQDQDATDKAYDSVIRLTDGIDKQTQQMKDQLATMGLEGTARELMLSQLQREEDLRQAAIGLSGEELKTAQDRINAAYNERDALISATGAAKDYQTQMKSLGQTLEAGLSDAIDTLLEKGKAGFKDLWDDFKSWAFKALAEVAARNIAVSLVGSAAAGPAGATENALTAMFGGGGTSGGGGSGLLSTISGLFGGGSNAPDAGMTGPPSSLAGGTGLFGVGSSGFSLGGVMGGAGTGAAIGTGAAALFGNDRNQQSMQIGGMIGGIAGSFFGPIGSMVGSMIGSAIGSLIKSGGGAKTGGFAQTGTDVAGRYFTPNDLDASVQKVVDTTATGYDSLVKALGGTSTAHFALGYDTDPKGTADSRVSVGVYGASGNELFKQGDVDAGRDDASLQAAITQETQRALLAALQQSDLPDDIAKILDTVAASTGSTDDITNVLALAGAFKQLMDVADGMKDPLTAASDALDDANKTGLQVWEEQRDAFNEMVKTVDPTVDGLNSLTAAANGLYQSTVQLLSGMIQAKQAMSSMFGDTKESIERAVLDPQQLYERLRTQTQALYDQLANATDPADITRLASQINQNVNDAFGMLSPDQQKQSADDYLQRLDDVDALAQQRMDIAMQAVQDQAAADSATLNDALTKILDGITGAAGDFKDGADSVSKAAAAGINVNVHVTDDRVTTSEVGG
jgi:hypothetical protein